MSTIITYTPVFCYGHHTVCLLRLHMPEEKVFQPFQTPFHLYTIEKLRKNVPAVTYSSPKTYFNLLTPHCV